ncbi:MAG TPA: hypothetical protein VKQ32_00280 [Polyangia bacterium]|nr:hypothetical protein [Polyangia bacterium]
MMLTIGPRRTPRALGSLLGAALACAACNGAISGHGSGTIGGAGGNSGGGGTGVVDPGKVTVPSTPFDAKTAFYATSKVKNLLTGMAVSDDDVAKVTATGAAGLQDLIKTWMTTDPYQAGVAAKMIAFFRNVFQQSGFVPTEDFKIQLLQNGGFDFGGSTRNLGDDAFPRLVQNLQDSFALTAWALVQENRPFTETLTTTRFQMTTALKSLYVQIEMPSDTNQRSTSTSVLNWTVDYSGNAIPIEQALTSMVWSDEAPALTSATNTGMCRGTGTVATGAYKGTSVLFQRLLGFTKQLQDYSVSPSTTICNDHPSKPYFTSDDVSDWQWVTIAPKASPADRTPAIQPYDLPSLRAATTLTLSLPRIGFYTTPAFLALWNTNDSNQHRVTANQTLLVALGRAFTAENTITPFSAAGLDSGHAVAGSECVGCHATLDPMRQFWANQLDYNDRNDFPAATRTSAGNPRPTGTLVDEFAFGDVRATGSSMTDLGGYLSMVTDGAGLPRFGIAIVQQLCFYANSSPCSESDPEFRRVVGTFRDGNYNYGALMKEFFSSPLVTGATATGTYDVGQVPISISRRDHLCAALSNRLGKPDLCAQAVALPSTAQAATARIAASVAADAFSRGAQSPVTPTEPTLFYRAASEELCENLAVQVVDAASGSVYSSSDVPGSINAMVETVMGYPPSHPLHAQAAQILMDHDTAVAQAASGSSATKATTGLRSAFVLACESPRAVGIGL